MAQDTLEVWTASWYPGDTLLRKTLAELESCEDAQGKFKVKIVDVDSSQSEAEGLRITTIPVARMLDSGKEVRREAGALGIGRLRDVAGLKPVRTNGKRTKKRSGPTAK